MLSSSSYVIMMLMRTTITLDEDVAKKLKAKIKSSSLPAKEVYNELLRSALSEKSKLTMPKKAFELVTFEGKHGLAPGFNWDMSTAQVLDKLDEESLKGPA